MEDIKQLGLQDLEAIAGGFNKEDLTPEERETHDKLYKRVLGAIKEVHAGTLDHSELLKYAEEYALYLAYLEKKY